MNKQLKFTYQDKEYVLEFTRKSVEMMEAQGFDAQEINKRPMTMLPKLFEGAFLANHRYVSKTIINEIYSRMGNRQELIGKLAEMYNEPIASLLEEPDDEGNVDWAASW